MSLRRQLIFAMLLLALGPLVVVTYQGYHCGRMAVLDKAHDHIQTLLDLKSSQIQSSLHQVEKDVALLAKQLQSLKNAPHANRRALLQSVLAQRPSYHSFSILNLQKMQHTYISRTPSELPHFFSDAFLARLQKSLPRQVLLSESHSHDDGTVIMHLGTPLPDIDTGSSLFLVAVIQLDLALQLALDDRSGLGRTGTAYLLTSDQQLLAVPRKPGGNPVPIVDSKLTSATPALYTGLNGTTVIGAGRKLPGPAWTLVVEQEESEILHWVQLLERRAFWTASIALLAALIAAILLARRISRPFRILSQTAYEVSRGAHNLRGNEHNLGAREAKILCRSFNDMLDHIESEHNRTIHQESLAAVGETTAGIVHEMRGPLSTVKLNMEAFSRKLAPDPKFKELGDIAREQVGRLEKMLDDLLQFGRPLRFSSQEVSLPTLIHKATSLVRDRANSSRIELEHQIDGEALLLMGDQEHLTRALTNLLENAIAFSPAESVIAIQAKPTGDGQAQIRISDQGPGISTDGEAHIFEPFYTTRKKGTGLGLANVKKIVRSHHGRITAGNTSTGGAVFEITLPLKGD